MSLKICLGLKIKLVYFHSVYITMSYSFHVHVSLQVNFFHLRTSFIFLSLLRDQNSYKCDETWSSTSGASDLKSGQKVITSCFGFKQNSESSQSRFTSPALKRASQKESNPIFTLKTSSPHHQDRPPAVCGGWKRQREREGEREGCRSVCEPGSQDSLWTSNTRGCLERGVTLPHRTLCVRSAKHHPSKTSHIKTSHIHSFPNIQGFISLFLNKER